MEDSELIGIILKGSMDHYATLVKRYQAKLQSVLGYYCTNMNDVEYYSHEAFVKAYRKLDKFQLGTSFFSWLRTLAINLIRDDVRKKKTLSEEAKEAILSRLDSENNSEEQLHALKKCMTQLEDKQQEVLKLRYWEETSIKELSSKFDRGQSALKMQILRIRESLKKCIEKETSHG